MTAPRPTRTEGLCQPLGTSGTCRPNRYRRAAIKQRNSCPPSHPWLPIISTAVDASSRSMVLINLRIDGFFFLYARSREVDQDDAYLANSYQTIRPLSPL